jgi:Tfp pilus assembly protein PilV
VIEMRRVTRRNKRRGLTLLEVMIAGSIMLSVTMTVAFFVRFDTLVWQNGMSDFSSQKAAQLAIQRMAPSIRAARKVVTSSSSSTKLTLQLPAYDAGGNLIVPLQNGQLVSYYLSDTTGNPSSSGDILWRSVNGTPDAAWSLQDGKGRAVLSAGGLQFTFYPTTDPESVTVSLTASSCTGTSTRELTTSQEVLLRNKGL